MKTFMLKQVPHNELNSIMHNASGLVFLFICLIGFGAYQAKAQNTQTFNSSGNFQVPANISKITVEAWGGGGAGGGSTDAGFLTARGGAGGGGGAYASTTIDVTPGSTISIVVAGQASGVSGGTGNDGGHSTVTGFEANIYAAGGKGGSGNTSGGSPAGGVGGSIADSEGEIITPGDNGENGQTETWPSSANSGAGGDGANGGGSGGASITSGSSNGNAGTQPGGGGGGSRTSQDEGNRTGGLGAAGRVVVSWINCPSIAASGTWNDATCFETNDGSITITASGGTGPYVYSIDNGLNFDASNVFNNLPPGEYRIRVKDLSTGCLSPEIP